MDLSAWVAYTFIAALVVAASVAHYRWREPPGSRRTVLGLIRGAALALILLLLFDPVVTTAPDGDGRTVALVDASLSMSLVEEAGMRRWEEAGEVLAALQPGTIQLFGAGESRAVAGLEGAAPASVRSRLAPALGAALERGAARVLVITDGALDDAGEVQRIVAAGSTPIEFRLVGGDTRANLGLQSVEAPAWVEVGEEVTLRATVGRVGDVEAGLPDSATVTLRRGEREVARTRVPVPAAGATSTAELRFRPEAAAEAPVRLDVRVAPGGAMPDDDVRSVYVRVAEVAAGVVLVSFSPDQEPRFLLPALERALGLPVRGWLGLRGGRFLRLGVGTEAGTVTPVAAVRRAVEQGALLVLHGLDADGPEWAREALRESERVLVLPSDPLPDLPMDVGPLQEGDWYLDPVLPSSPVAALLAGVDPTGLPPLHGLRPVDLPAGRWSPLVARLGRRGEAHPILAIGRGSGQRMGIALGAGYWRWSFAGERGREVYERLWSAVAGWLMEDLEGLDRERIRPATRVVERGAPVEWRVAVGDSLTVVLERVGPPAAADAGGRGTDEATDAVTGPADAASALARDTTVLVEEGRAVTGVLAPGHYRYEARSAAGDAGAGELTVESYSPELLHAVRPLEGGAGDGGAGATVREGRPLHTTPWPYILLVALLCVEWVLRRRWGLR